jgi:hypothetical protein
LVNRELHEEKILEEAVWNFEGEAQVEAVGPEGDDTAAMLHELYPDLPMAKGGSASARRSCRR